MYTLVDGYNLLHAIGFRGDLSAPGNLQSARTSMLDKLAKYVSLQDRQQMIVVFDAGRRDREKPRQYVRHQIRVEFAFGFDDADSMIEWLIRKHAVPKKLLVVSSDHRIQNAAKRRQAKFVDSEVWIEQLEYPSSVRRPSQVQTTKPKLKENADYWLQLFDSAEVEEMVEQASEHEVDRLDESSSSSSSSSSDSVEKSDVDQDFNPFPEGYGEDFLDESDQQ